MDVDPQVPLNYATPKPGEPPVLSASRWRLAIVGLVWLAVWLGVAKLNERSFALGWTFFSLVMALSGLALFVTATTFGITDRRR